jgi:hypothetical protein
MISEGLTKQPTTVQVSDISIDVKETVDSSTRMIVLKKDGTYESYLKE